MDSGSVIGKAVIYLFVAIFCAIGLGLLCIAVHNLVKGNLTNSLIMLVAALAFSGCGLTIYAATRAGLKSLARESAMRKMYPGEPWMWREDWAGGRIRCTGRSAVWFFWIFAIFWSFL
jgi:hypothetical protein